MRNGNFFRVLFWSEPVRTVILCRCSTALVQFSAWSHAHPQCSQFSILLCATYSNIHTRRARAVPIFAPREELSRANEIRIYGTTSLTS
jgi:hypothetical protein